MAHGHYLSPDVKRAQRHLHIITRCFIPHLDKPHTIAQNGGESGTLPWSTNAVRRAKICVVRTPSDTCLWCEHLFFHIHYYLDNNTRSGLNSTSWPRTRRRRRRRVDHRCISARWLSRASCSRCSCGPCRWRRTRPPSSSATLG